MIEKDNYYSVEVNNMIISCEHEPDEELETYGKLLVEKYTQALEAIAQYILTIAYCDEDYVIEFEIQGCYTDFKNFEISS